MAITSSQMTSTNIGTHPQIPISLTNKLVKFVFTNHDIENLVESLPRVSLMTNCFHYTKFKYFWIISCINKEIENQKANHYDLLRSEFIPGYATHFYFLLSNNHEWFLYRIRCLFNEHHERFFWHHRLKSTHKNLNSRHLSNCLLMTHWRSMIDHESVALH